MHFTGNLDDKEDVVRLGPWPDDVQLFQPQELDQITLPDSAKCLSVQTYLRMCNLKYEVVCRKNAAEMSPSGRVPFIKCKGVLVSEFEPITMFVRNKFGVSLSESLDNMQRADMHVYMALVDTVMACAENYMSWVDRDTFSQVTRQRYGSVHPWPLNWILTRRKRNSVFKWLNALDWRYKSVEEVYEEVDDCLSALSERLGDSKYFFGDKPTELDALVFAHIYTVLKTDLPCGKLFATVLYYHKLVQHSNHIEQDYFGYMNYSEGCY